MERTALQERLARRLPAALGPGVPGIGVALRARSEVVWAADRGVADAAPGNAAYSPQTTPTGFARLAGALLALLALLTPAAAELLRGPTVVEMWAPSHSAGESADAKQVRRLALPGGPAPEEVARCPC